MRSIYLPLSATRSYNTGGFVRETVELAALYSGGKDSNYALYLAQLAGHEVVNLVTVHPEEGSWMYHVPNIRWTGLQAQALGIPQVTERAGEGEERELEALSRALARTEVEGVVVGAVASDYQHARVNKVCDALGLWVHAPLWKKDPRRLLVEYMAAGFHIVVVSVSAEGMGEEWLGRPLDQDACEDILRLSSRYGVHPVGEGGEFETVVLDGPNFSSRLEVLEAEPVWEGSSGTFRILDARLVEKV